MVPAGCLISLGPWASLCFTGIVGRRGCQRRYLPHTKESCLWMERFAFSLHELGHGLQSWEWVDFSAVCWYYCGFDITVPL